MMEGRPRRSFKNFSSFRHEKSELALSQVGLLLCLVSQEEDIQRRISAHVQLPNNYREKQAFLSGPMLGIKGCYHSVL